MVPIYSACIEHGTYTCLLFQLAWLGWLGGNKNHSNNDPINDTNGHAHPACDPKCKTDDVEDLGNVGIATSFFISARVPGWINLDAWKKSMTNKIWREGTHSYSKTNQIQAKTYSSHMKHWDEWHYVYIAFNLIVPVHTIVTQWCCNCILIRVVWKEYKG